MNLFVLYLIFCFGTYCENMTFSYLVLAKLQFYCLPLQEIFSFILQILWVTAHLFWRIFLSPVCLHDPFLFGNFVFILFFSLSCWWKLIYPLLPRNLKEVYKKNLPQIWHCVRVRNILCHIVSLQWN